MPRKKATESGAESVEEVIEVKGPFAAVPGMIEKMAKDTSLDLNKHQIQASILGRLENWAKKRGLDDEWMLELPKHLPLVRQVADARYAATERFKERNRLEKARLLARSELEAE